jgi:hypothetical protein
MALGRYGLLTNMAYNQDMVYLTNMAYNQGSWTWFTSPTWLTTRAHEHGLPHQQGYEPEHMNKLYLSNKATNQNT